MFDKLKKMGCSFGLVYFDYPFGLDCFYSITSIFEYRLLLNCNTGRLLFWDIKTPAHGAAADLLIILRLLQPAHNHLANLIAYF